MSLGVSEKSKFNEININESSNCVIDALMLAFNVNKNEMIDLLLEYKEKNNIKDEIQSEVIWGKYLLDNGYEKILIQAKIGEKRCTLEDFMKNIKFINDKEKVILRLGRHIVYVNINGYYDRYKLPKDTNVYYYYKLKEVR
jgi:hypothetical protein